MKLLRLATAYFDPEPEGWTSWVSQIGRVTIRARPVSRTDVSEPEHAKRGRVLIAEIGLSSVPKPGADGLIDIPDVERRLCEHAIEAAANLVSVLTRTQRRLSTPWPPIALLVENEDEKRQLEDAQAFRYRTVSSKNALPPTLKPEPKLMAGLVDRLDGVQAVATFNSQAQPLGQYREAIRFFEMAFARPISAIDKKLAQFLSSGKFGYTRDEVTEWVSHRHGATHADGKVSHDLVWDADVAQFMDRIEQALYDVLLNKEDWHSPSQTRRDLWRPLAGTLDKDGGIFVTEKTGGIRLMFQIFDGFSSYPHDMSANLNNLPAEWWCKYPHDLSGQAESENADEPTSPRQPAELRPVSEPLPEDPPH
jgi:hypothetical protein